MPVPVPVPVRTLFRPNTMDTGAPRPQRSEALAVAVGVAVGDWKRRREAAPGVVVPRVVVVLNPTTLDGTDADTSASATSSSVDVDVDVDVTVLGEAIVVILRSVVILGPGGRQGAAESLRTRTFPLGEKR